MKFYALIFCMLVFSMATTSESSTKITSQKDEVQTRHVLSPKLSDYEIAMYALKSHEGLHYKPYWDYKQYTIGWGTKSSKNDRVTYQQANQRAKDTYQKRYNRISKAYPNLSRFQKLVITNFQYNTGIGKDLNKALKSGDMHQVKKQMNRYVHAGGRKLDGLVKRRAQESYLMTATESEKQAFGQKARTKVKAHITKARNR